MCFKVERCMYTLLGKRIVFLLDVQGREQDPVVNAVQK